MSNDRGTLGVVPEGGTERIVARPGRCANHPGVVQAAACARCGRPLCLSCAVPVRGAVFGPECLPLVLVDVPVQDHPPAFVLPRGDALAALGFGLVVALSIFPWSKFGDASGILEAWTRHWSLLAVSGATVGLVLAVAFWTRPRDPRLEASLYLVLAITVGWAAYLHRQHPPPLSSPSFVPLVAMAGAALSAVAAAMKAAALFRARWAGP